MTKRIRDFLVENTIESPCLILDLDVVRQNFIQFRRAFPDTKIYYAVKANPAIEILRLLNGLNASFDAASLQEVRLCLEAGVDPEKISYGNTIKKERDIAEAYANGVQLFAVDSVQEVEKISRAAPLARIFCRILCDDTGADWPLSRKFGCTPEMAVDVLELAHRKGLEAYGVSFHVGSQQNNSVMWDSALASSAAVFRKAAERGITLSMVNMGGGFPIRYLKSVPDPAEIGDSIFKSLRDHFGNQIPETIIEPGRGLVGNAGIIQSEVVLISKKSDVDTVRWIYLDIGKFGGLAETMDEAIRYPIKTLHDTDAHEPCIIAGPTCDSVDVLYEKEHYMLPISLDIGDAILIENTGAYTTTYASVGFNGFEPLRSYVI